MVNFKATLGATGGLKASFGSVSVIDKGGGNAYPSDDLPLMDGIASSGESAKYSRSDHVHPNDEIKLNTTDRITNMELEQLLQ